MTKLTSHKSSPLRGDAAIPGDKSISHRALMFGGLCIGETTVTGLLEGEDVMHTADAMRAMGAQITRNDTTNTWHIHGVGIGGLQQPKTALEMGNSGTSTRLLMGLVASHPITAIFTGDASLNKRPMNRVINPLTDMGGAFMATDGGRLPITVRGSDDLRPIEYRLPIASAQVKSCILLAGLNTRGATTVIEDKSTRDHTENMLRAFGVNVDIEDIDGGAQAITVKGWQDMKPCHINVPSDPSSAAFPAVAAILNEGSDITMRNICMNPRRAGVFETLIEMSADITYSNKTTQGGEPVADIRVRGLSGGGGALNAIDVPPSRVPSMIDEFPILAMAAACANGVTRMTGLEELRVKESDRLLMVARGLEACGVKLDMGEDSLTIYGTGKPPKGIKVGGAPIKTALDHRIAMSFLILGGVTDNPVTIDDGAPINTSFPTFMDLMNGLGMEIKP